MAGHWRRGKLEPVKKRATASLAEESQLPPGLEPTTLENLKESQMQLAARGLKMSLRQVYDLEYDQYAQADHLEQSGLD